MKILSRNAVKWIACVTMLCDHFAMSFLDPESVIYFIMRMVIGRIAYPVFCALFIEGFHRTSHLWKHVRDLFLFGLLSELFFDRALYGTWMAAQAQNVMFSWCLAFLLLICYAKMEKYAKDGTISRGMKYGMYAVLCFVFMLAADFLHMDYLYAGILAVTAGYFLYAKFGITGAVCGVAAVIAVTCRTPGSVLAIPVVMLYDPDKTCSRTAVAKYGVYAFYPVHLALMSLAHIFLS